MISGHDHIIHYAADTAAFQRICMDFEAAGFMLTDREDEGRDQAPTRQTLVCFSDGTYIELLTVPDSKTRDSHRLASHMQGRSGWVDFTVLTDRLEEAMVHQRKAGLPVRGPIAYEKRLTDGRPWGVVLALIGIGIGHPALPFLLQDKMGRELRVPRGRIQHPNGATGIAGVVVQTPDWSAARDHYRPLFGDGQVEADGAYRYDLASGAWVRLEAGTGGLVGAVLHGPPDATTTPEMARLGLSFVRVP